ARPSAAPGGNRRCFPRRRSFPSIRETAVADVFLSYAKEDRSRAKIFATLLESCGWSVFWDHKIGVGDEGRQVLESELDRASVVVVLWSHHSVKSTWVHDEAERGRARLVQVLIDDVAPPIGFGSVQAVNLVGWQGGQVDGVAKLVDAVASTSRLPPKQAPTIPASPSRRRAIVAGLAPLAV